MNKIFKTLAYAFDGILIAIFLGAAFNTSLVIYGFDQGKGQLKIVLNSQPISDVLEDPEVADSIKARLRLIGEIKKFAIDSIGLKATDNYTSYYNQHEKPLLWVLTASEQFALKPYEWNFPLLGTVSYKGFFDYRKGKKEEQDLKHLDYDTDYDDVSAWSTLGWFRDPVLSGMLKRDAGSLAELIIHEMTHGTIYLKSSVNFNENFANAIGEAGASRFLLWKFGPESAPYETYLERKSDQDLYSRYMIASAARLDSLYKTMHPGGSVWEKGKLKKQLMTSIANGIDSLPFKQPGKFRNIFSHQLPDNTYFLSFLRYDLQKDRMRKELNEKFGGNFKAYFEFIRAQNKQ